MRLLREMTVEYKYEKYVKHPQLFCQLDWWYAKDAFIPNYTDKEILNQSRSSQTRPFYVTSFKQTLHPSFLEGFSY